MRAEEEKMGRNRKRASVQNVVRDMEAERKKMNSEPWEKMFNVSNAKGMGICQGIVPVKVWEKAKEKEAARHQEQEAKEIGETRAREKARKALKADASTAAETIISQIAHKTREKAKGKEKG